MKAECVTRLVVAAAMVGATVVLRPAATESVGKVAALICAIAFFILQLERHNLRSQAVSTVVACLDSILIAVALTHVGRLETLGFLVLGPIAFAASQHGASPSAMAPIASGSLIAASTLWGRNPQPTLTLILQSCAVLLLGLLLNHRRVIVKVAQPVLPESIEPIANPEPVDTLELRESYRRLKEMYKDLETRSIHDHMAVQLMKARLPGGDRFAKQLATQLRDLTGVDGLAMYQVAQFDQRFVVTATCGEYPNDIRDSSLTFELNASVLKIQSSVNDMLRANLSAEAREHVSNCMVRQDGRLMAMVVLTHRDSERLREAAAIVDRLEPWLANLIANEQARVRGESRLKSAELLYQLVSHLTGAKTPTHLAARCAKVMDEWLELDHISFNWLDEAGSVVAVSTGTSLKLLEIIQFAGGTGLPGWKALGAPAVWMPDVHDDERVASREATKRRIGSFAVVPIQFDESPFGFLTAATHRSGGIDADIWAFLTAIAQELSQAVARLQNTDTWESGLATISEFQQAVADESQGHVVVFQPVRREQLIESYGHPTVEKALRELAQKIRQQLPANALLTRRHEGDFVALLRGVSAEFAQMWANRVAASSALIGLGPFAQSKRLPLPIRAKVATIRREPAESKPQGAETLVEAVVQAAVFPEVKVKTSRRKTVKSGK